ncbi:uncharacterized protein EV420DRAFT_1515674 [Desarmillaria tabescens]|uniref:Secreted protein n=1 Tax=Armillaria tabescens TaxID=1929756 RepID=A0AA39NEQ1_ARMTA|nr:uncharacterized protein EV420DRAFT_1515674 [Desarmillaria tabescens]KAK0464281.1 hypothetical protein EV420DRAFT_1515674 [Desarmillaria tabescens]
MRGSMVSISIPKLWVFVCRATLLQVRLGFHEEPVSNHHGFVVNRKEPADCSLRAPLGVIPDAYQSDVYHPQ